MARATEWRRSFHEYANGATEISGHNVVLCELADGETLTRVRFQWQAQHASNFAAHGAGMMVAAGIITVPKLGGFPIPEPILHRDDPWIWWNGSIFETVVSFEDAGGTITNLDCAPARVQEVDVRAQRTATPGGDFVYFLTGTSTLSPTQSTHYLSVSASCLVMLPA